MAFLFDDFKNCIELNKKALQLRLSQGQVGGLLDGNWCNIGLAYFELQDYNEALNSLESALKVNKHCVAAMVNMAMVQKRMGQFDKATALLEEVVTKIDPRDNAAINNLANIHHEQGKFE